MEKVINDDPCRITTVGGSDRFVAEEMGLDYLIFSLRAGRRRLCTLARLSNDRLQKFDSTEKKL